MLTYDSRSTVPSGNFGYAQPKAKTWSTLGASLKLYRLVSAMIVKQEEIDNFFKDEAKAMEERGHNVIASNRVLWFSYDSTCNHLEGKVARSMKSKGGRELCVPAEKEIYRESRSADNDQKCRDDSWDESSESDQVGSNELSDSTTDDFQSESEFEGCSGSEEVPKEKEGAPWPGASGDATSEHESVLQRKPPAHRDAERIQKVLKTLQDTLKIVDTSATRPTTPTVCPPDQSKQEEQESRGGGDTYLGARECSAWAAWYLAKKREIAKKRQETHEEMETKRRLEMEERALKERRRELQVVAFQEWLQRKEAQRDASEKERALKLEEIRQKEDERLLATKEASQRARAEWCKRKDRERKERRLQEEKERAEAKEKEQRRRAVAEKQVKEWQKFRAGRCALNGTTFLNPKPWINIVEMPEEEEETHQTKVPTSRHRRRTRREQEKICERLSRPSRTSIPTTKEPEVDSKKLSWLQRVKKKSNGTRRPEPATRCASARPRTRENLDIILSRSDYKSPASRTSDWIESIISRRYGQDRGGGESRGNPEIPQETGILRSKPQEENRKPKNRKIKASSAAQRECTASRTKPKPELNRRTHTETR